MCAEFPGGASTGLTNMYCVHTLCNMFKTDRINFRLGPELREALQAFAQRYDRTEADVIRESVWLLLESKGYGRPTRKGAKKR